MRRDREIFNGAAFILPASAASLRDQIASLSPESLLTREGSSNRESTYQIRGKTAILDIVGPLTYHQNFFSRFYGWTTYERLALDFRTLLDHASIENIVLRVDSVGGMVFGLEEMADLIFASRERKNIASFVAGHGASAAYALASSASVVWASKGAWLGSVGTVISILDDSEAKRRMGLSEITVVSKQSPHKAPDFTTEKGVGLLRSLVDQSGANLVALVARNRGVSEKKVLDDFGEGWVLEGVSAQEAGLCDKIGGLEHCISFLETENSTQAKGTMNEETKNETSDIEKKIARLTEKLETNESKLKTLEGELVNQKVLIEALDKRNEELTGQNQDPLKENEILKSEPTSEVGGKIHGGNSAFSAHPGY